MLGLMTLVDNKFHYLITVILFFLIGCSNEKQSSYLEISGFAQGTTFKIIYNDSHKRDFSLDVDSILRDFDNELSLYIDSSELSKFNQLGNHYYLSNQSNYIRDCFRKSKEIYKLTRGAFNPAIYPLSKYWGFNNYKFKDSVSHSAIDSLLLFSSFADSSFYLVYD